MGKGYRNRDERGSSDEVFTKGVKIKKRKKARGPMPKWILPAIAAVLALCAVVGIVFGILSGNGTLKRNNVLVKSHVSSKYSVNQPAAEIIMWYVAWMEGLQTYQNNVNQGQTTASDSAMFVECFNTAYSAKIYSHDVIESAAEWLEEQVAMCDWGVKTGVPFTAQEEQTAMDNLVASFDSQAKLYWSYYGQSTTDMPYLSIYLKDIFGNNVQRKDIRRAARILAYADKVENRKNAEYWLADQAVIDEEIKNHPENSYSTAYLAYQTDSATLALDLASNATDADSFKKIIVTDYVKNHNREEYNKGFAEPVLTAVQNQTAETIAEALAAQEMTTAVYAKDTESLTKAQKDWLFDSTRTAYEATTVTNDGGTVSVLVITDSKKDEESQEITEVTAAVKTFSNSLTDEQISQITNEVCHEVGVSHEHADLSEELSSVAGALTSSVQSILPSEYTAYYIQPTELQDDAESVKTALESATDKVEYLEKTLQASQHQGATQEGISDEKIREAVFAEDVAEGTIKIVTDSEEAVHLLYVSAVETNPDDGSKKITYYDYTADTYSNAFAKWLFSDVNFETMEGIKQENERYFGGTLVAIVTRALGFGNDVVRGGYLSFAHLEDAQAAKEKLNGLTGYSLLEKLKEIDSGATVSNIIDQSSLPSNAELLKEWMFDESRTESDFDVIYHEDEAGNVLDGIYLAVYLGRLSDGQGRARDNYADEQTHEWSEQLVKDGGYQLSASALKKIKNMKVETTTTDAE